MKTIQWNNLSYQIDGKSEFLVSGEFHYFRVPKKDWKSRLELLKAAGGNCVATYIPWILHEPIEGEFLFGDIPERDLEGFLQLCSEMELFVVCRPGPYQYSEMRYCGLPGWLSKRYPQILARDVGGRIMVKDSVSYLHPDFLQRVKNWFDAVCPIVSRYTIQKGGSVAFVQFDNELTGIHEWFGGWDYNPETMGFGRENGRYGAFLRNRYGSVEKLNEVYGTGFAGFMDARPLDKTPDNSGERRRAKDYQDFYFSTVAEYAGILTGWMRESGIDCDFIHNSANSGSNSYYLETVETLPNNFILGVDLYYNLHMDWEGNNPTPKYAVNVLFAHETLRHMGFPSTVYELPGGSCSDWPPILPEDLECCYLTNIAFGMKGFNYYVFTGGYNPENIGGDGNIYDYRAAIGPDNSIRPHYYTQKDFGTFIHENRWLSEAERSSDFYLGLDWEYSRSKYYDAGYHGFGSTEAWTFLKKGLVITALCSSYSPELLDLYNDSFTTKTDKPLFIASADCMSRPVQERLVVYVKNGGRLLLAPVIPMLDENYRPCTILRDFLGDTGSRRLDLANVNVKAGDTENIFINGGLWGGSDLPGGAEVIAGEMNSGETVAWKKAFPGGGRVVWLGIQWKFAKYGHRDMMKYLLEQLECGSPVVECDNPNIWTSLRTDGTRTMLFIMNLFSSPVNATIKVKGKDGSYSEPKAYSLKPMEVKTIKC